MEKEQKIQIEYERIKNIFNGVDEKQLSLMDGTIVEAARIRVELDELHQIEKETGLLKVNPNNLSQQKELPVNKLLTKNRANYISYMSKLSNLLGKNIEEDGDDLEDFE